MSERLSKKGARLGDFLGAVGMKQERATDRTGFASGLNPGQTAAPNQGSLANPKPNPLDIYFERVARNAKEHGNQSAIDYFKFGDRPKGRDLIVSCSRDDGFEHNFHDDNVYEWNSGVDFSKYELSISPDWCSRKSLIPVGFKLRQSFQLRSARYWEPPTGIPSLILKKSRRASKRSEKVKDSVALLDMFLYTFILGRIPRKAINDLMGWETWKRIEKEKLDSGEWELIADAINFKNRKTGKMDGRAAVYAITPKYFLEIFESDISKERYPTYAALNNRKRFKLGGVDIEYSEFIPDDVREFLGKGTGLKAVPERLVHMLFEPGSYRSENYSAVEVWEKAQQGWKTLSPYFHGQLVTSWSQGKNGWLYDSKPALQQQSKMIRMLCLKGSTGERICEVDYSGCQLNIARAMTGAKPLDDPYQEVMWDASNLGIFMKRSAAKLHTLAILGGRTLKHYEYLHSHGIETDPISYYEAVLMSLRKRGYPINDIRVRQKQGRIMCEVMRRMVEETERTGLSVFDAILLPSSQIEIGRMVMKEASESILGVPLPFSSSVALL